MIKQSLCLIVACALALSAQAGNKSKPTKDCPPPAQSAAPSTSIGVGSTSSAGQSQEQSQSNAATASASNAAKSASNATGGTSSAFNQASSGPSTSTSGQDVSNSALNQSSTNSGNYTYREAANVVQPATMIIQGCQVQGQAGGSNTRGAAMLGIGFTPKNCYDYIQAQAYLAIGAQQAACEILNHTEAAQRAVRNGAVLPACAAPAVAIAVPGMYTREQVNEIVRKVTSK